jgi:phthiodiolone/phenolphthiodiolone dimycocerosates ketoreductase
MAHAKMTVGMYVPAQPPLGDVRQLVLASRALRLDSMMVWDHVQDFIPRAIWDTDLTWAAARSTSPHEWYEFQTLLGYIAGRAGRLRIGVGVTEPIRRHPVIIAQAMMTLAHMTKRPPILGLGAGERENTEPYGLSLTQQVGKLEEAVQIVRQCFVSDGPFDFAGQHFQLDGAVVDLKSPPGRTPDIWIAASGPRMLRITGTYGDGWYPSFGTTLNDYVAKLAVIHDAARAAGRDPAAITPVLDCQIVVAPTAKEARSMLDAKVIRFMGLLYSAEVWQRFGARHPFGPEYRGYMDFIPERHSKEEIEEGIRQVPDEMLADMLIWGTPEQVTKRLRAYGDAGCRHVVIGLMSALISRKAAFNGLRAMWSISRALRE